MMGGRRIPPNAFYNNANTKRNNSIIFLTVSNLNIRLSYNFDYLLFPNPNLWTIQEIKQIILYLPAVQKAKMPSLVCFSLPQLIKQESIEDQWEAINGSLTLLQQNSSKNKIVSVKSVDFMLYVC